MKLIFFISTKLVSTFFVWGGNQTYVPVLGFYIEIESIDYIVVDRRETFIASLNRQKCHLSYTKSQTFFPFSYTLWEAASQKPPFFVTNVWMYCCSSHLLP